MAFLNSKPLTFSTPGYHVARCVGIIEYGTIFIVSKWQAQVRFTWELPEDRREFTPGTPPRPKLVSKEYASNLYGKSHLKRHLLSWVGQETLDKLDQSFDPSLLLGVPCYVKIEHRRNANTGAWYEDIAEIEPCAPSQCEAQYHDSQLLTYDNFDLDVFNSLPAFIANRVMSSKEFATLKNVSYKPKVAEDKPFG